MYIRVATANMWQNNPDPVAGVRRLNRAIFPWASIDFLGLQETSKFNEKLRALITYYVYFNNRILYRYNRSNANLTHTRNKVSQAITIPAASGIQNKDGKWGVTPPRNINITLSSRRGQRFAHINSHLHVVDEGSFLGKPYSALPVAGKQYVDHIMKLSDLALSYKRSGYRVVVTLDGNTRPVGNNDWQWAAYEYLSWTTHMTVVRNGVDLVAWFPGQFTFKGKKIIRKEVIGSDDHAAIVVRLATR